MENIETKSELINLAPLEQSVPKDLTPRRIKKMTTPAEDATEALRLRMREKVKGIFHFYECPQGSMEFTYKEFKNDPVEKYSMIDGQIYEVPLGVARHLNRSGKYPLYGYTKDPEGRVSMRKEKMVSRFGFESLMFKEYDELDNKLV